MRLGNSAAPVIRACASACTKRAVAAAMSRLTVWASSIRPVSSRRPKTAPPVERRRRILRGRKPGRLVALGHIERRVGKILGQDAARGTGDQAQHRKRPRQRPAAWTAGKPAIDRATWNSLGHTRSPPGKSRPGAATNACSDGLRHVHGGDASVGTSGIILALGTGRGQSRTALSGRAPEAAKGTAKNPSCPYFMGLLERCRDDANGQNLTKISWGFSPVLTSRNPPFCTRCARPWLV